MPPSVSTRPPSVCAETSAKNRSLLRCGAVLTTKVLKLLRPNLVVNVECKPTAKLQVARAAPAARGAYLPTLFFLRRLEGVWTGLSGVA